MINGASFSGRLVHLMFCRCAILRFLLFDVWFLLMGFQAIGFSEEHVFCRAKAKRARMILVFRQGLLFGRHRVLLGVSGFLRFGWIFCNGGFRKEM